MNFFFNNIVVCKQGHILGISFSVQSACLGLRMFKWTKIMGEDRVLRLRYRTLINRCPA